MAVISIMMPDGLPFGAFALWVLFSALAAVGALVQQHGRVAPSGLKGLTWACLAYVAACVGMTFFVMPILAISLVGAPAEDGLARTYQLVSEGFNYFSVVFDILVGVTGFLLIRDARRPNQPDPPEHRSKAYETRGTDPS
jgi:hypothetical protein